MLSGGLVFVFIYLPIKTIRICTSLGFTPLIRLA
jgi:hypothetical protein